MPVGAQMILLFFCFSTSSSSSLGLRTHWKPLFTISFVDMRSFLASTAIALLLWGISCASPAAEAHPESDASVFSDLDIALKEDASRFKYYTMPTKGAGPCDLTTGPDGMVCACLLHLIAQSLIRPIPRQHMGARLPREQDPADQSKDRED